MHFTIPHNMAMIHSFIFSLFLLTGFFNLSLCDFGNATHYSPPYTPTACHGNDPSQFPTSNFFAAAGEGIWNNGAACDRQYEVRCISAATTKICIPGKAVQVIIVDRAANSSSRPLREDATLVLSTTAFAAIADSSANSINILYQPM